MSQRTSQDHLFPPDVEKSASSQREPMSFTWESITFKVKGRDTPILDGIDGGINSGELMAFMGASGAGKSSLLDCLAKRVACEGSVRVLSFPSFIAVTDSMTRFF